MRKAIKNKTLLGCFCAFGCEVLFGLSFVFTKKATDVAGEFELLGWRFFIAFAVMSLCVVTGLIPVNFKGKPIQRLIPVSIFCPVLDYIGETVGISHTSATESGILFACIPVVSLIASALLLKKKPTKWQIVGIGITLFGVLVTVLAVEASASLSVVGYLFLTMSVVSCALYAVFTEKASAFTGAEITYGMLAFGAVIFTGIALVQAMINGTAARLLALPFQNTDFLIAVLYQGIGCSILAFFMSNVAIANIGVNRVSSFMGVSTVTSIIAGVLILQEKLSLWQIVGAVVIVAGIYTANIRLKTE